MNKYSCMNPFLLTLFFVATTMALLPATTCAQVIDKNAELRAKEIVSKMTLREKIDYISGETSFSLRAIPRLGIPRILLADGPQGIRNHAPHTLSFRHSNSSDLGPFASSSCWRRIRFGLARPWGRYPIRAGCQHLSFTHVWPQF